MLHLSYCLLAVYLARGILPVANARPSFHHQNLQSSLLDQSLYHPDHINSHSNPFRTSTNPFDEVDDNPKNPFDDLPTINGPSALQGFGGNSHIYPSQSGISSGSHTFSMDMNPAHPTIPHAQYYLDNKEYMEALQHSFGKQLQVFQPPNNHYGYPGNAHQSNPLARSTNPFDEDFNPQQPTNTSSQPKAPGTSIPLNGIHQPQFQGNQEPFPHELNAQGLSSLMSVKDEAISDSVFGSGAYGSAEKENSLVEYVPKVENQEFNRNIGVLNSDSNLQLIDFVPMEKDHDMAHSLTLQDYADVNFMLTTFSKFEEALRESMNGIKPTAKEEYTEIFQQLVGGTLILSAQLMSAQRRPQLEELKENSTRVADFVIHKFISVLKNGLEDEGDKTNKELIQLITTGKQEREYWTPVFRLTCEYAKKDLLIDVGNTADDIDNYLLDLLINFKKSLHTH